MFEKWVMPTIFGQKITLLLEICPDFKLTKQIILVGANFHWQVEQGHLTLTFSQIFMTQNQQSTKLFKFEQQIIPDDSLNCKIKLWQNTQTTTQQLCEEGNPGNTYHAVQYKTDHERQHRSTVKYFQRGGGGGRCLL